MKLIGKINSIREKEIVITSKYIPEGLYELIEKEQEITIEDEKKQRSKGANALLWKYLGKLQDHLGIPKDELYQEYIRRCGVYDVVSLKTEAVERFIETWQSNGLGNICEIAERGEENSLILCHRGSSSYTTKEMSFLINEVEEDLKEFGIETEPKEYVESLLKEYEDEQKTRSEKHTKIA